MNMILKRIRKKLKVFSILSSILLLMPTQTDVKACVSEDDFEEQRYMLFNPDLLHNKSWWTFFFNNDLDFMDASVFASDDEQLLAAEWKKMAQLKSSTEEIEQGLFGSLPDSILVNNPFYMEIQRNGPLKKYFEIARQAEVLAALPSPWDDDAEQEAQRIRESNTVIHSIQEALTAESNDFLKKKYAFQLLKMCFYTQHDVLFTTTYQQYFQSATPRSVLDWWAVHYKSMMLESEENLDSANYLHALVFSHASRKMLVSKRMFSNRNLDAVLALAQNDNEQADIHLIAGVINPGRAMETIQKVYALSPSHKHLPMLIGREINKLEDWLGSEKFANSQIVSSDSQYPQGRRERDIAYLQELAEFMEGMDAFEKSYPEYFHLSLASLYLLGTNTEGAERHLSALDTTEPETEFQKKIFEAILISLKKDISKPSVQQELGTIFEYLLTNRTAKFQSEKMLYSLSSYLRYTFAQKGMIHLAGLFNHYAVHEFCFSCDFATFDYAMISYLDQYASIADMQKLLEVYDRKDKNKLEEVLLAPYSNKFYLYDLLGTLYLRQGNVKNAAETFKMIPDHFWFTFANASYYLDMDPFLNNVELLSKPGMAVYNKREIAEKLWQLESEAAQNPESRQRNYFLLANAWYNFTRHSWFMLSYGHSEYEDLSAYAHQALNRASTYYKKSLSLATSDEDKAKLNYMMAVLSEGADEQKYQLAYEKFGTTEFYARRNCLTSRELAEQFPF